MGPVATLFLDAGFGYVGNFFTINESTSYSEFDAFNNSTRRNADAFGMNVKLGVLFRFAETYPAAPAAEEGNK